MNSLKSLKNKERFSPSDSSTAMKAVVTLSNGGYEMLSYQDVPVPQPSDNEVLIQVLAAGINNTEINNKNFK